MTDSYARWIVNNATKLKMKVEHLDWIGPFFPEIEDVHVIININDKIYKGRGHSNTQDNALKKAISEAVERIVGLEFAESTNGIASHFRLDLAKENARNELIERDLFLCHFMTNTPFIFSRDLTNLIPEGVRSYISDEGDSISIYSMRHNSIGKGLVCLISGKDIWGGIVGLSFGTECDQQLVVKATLEAFRLYWHRRSRKSLHSGLPIHKFLEQTSWTFVDHGNLCLNLEYFKSIQHLFSAEKKIETAALVYYDLTEFSFEILSDKYSDLYDCPLYVVRCTSPYAQKLLAGPFNSENFSIEGLRRFTNNNEYHVNKLPHPVN